MGPGARQLPAAEAAAADATAHLDWLGETLDRLAGPPTAAPQAETLWVLVGPERPLCGPLGRLLLEQLPAEGPVGLVGTRLIEVAQADPALLARLRFHLPAASTSDELNERAEAIASEILRLPELPSVVLLHPTATGTRLARRLLLAGARSPVDGGPETLSPRDVVLQAVANEAIVGRLAVVLAEAMRAEVRARMAAADAARRSSGKQLDALRQRWQVLRQESITRELVELTSARQVARARAAAAEAERPPALDKPPPLA